MLQFWLLAVHLDTSGVLPNCDRLLSSYLPFLQAGPRKSPDREHSIAVHYGAMPEPEEQLIIQPDNKDFAQVIDEIFCAVESELRREDIPARFFQKLKEDWKIKRPPRTGGEWIEELLRGANYSRPELVVAKAANSIRQKLEKCSKGRLITVEIPLREYALRAVCNLVLPQRPLKPPDRVIAFLAADLSDWIVSPILSGIEKVIREKGYELLVRGARDNSLTEKKCLEEMSALAKGIIAIPVWDGDPYKAYTHLVQSHFPLVFVDRSIQSLDEHVSSATSDNFDGGLQATQYLIEKHGCHNIHILGDYPVSAAHQRIEGSKKAVETAALDGPFVHQAEKRQSRTAASQWAFSMTVDLIRNKKLCEHDGVFALNDQVAAGCRSAIEAFDLAVPVIGFDGQQWGAFLSPPLDTILQDMDGMAAKAASTLLLHIEGVRAPLKAYLPVQLRTAEARLRERTA